MAKQKLTHANYEAIRDHLYDRIHRTGEQIKNDFPNTLRVAIKNEAWKNFTDGEGKPFANLVDWLHYTFPNGVSMGNGEFSITYEQAIKLTEDVKVAKDVHLVLLEHASKGKPGPKPKGENGELKVARPLIDRGNHGGSKTKVVLSARLAQEKPKFYDDYLTGKYKSVRAAAEAAGLVKPGHDPMMRVKAYWKKLTKEQRAEFMEWMKTEEKQ